MLPTLKSANGRILMKYIPTSSLIAVALLAITTTTRAANPADGTVIPSTTTTVEWDGTAIGTGATDETSAIEGVNRDTFVLHVAAGDYTNKTIAVKVAWTVPANDYDLYSHKRNADGSDGDFVAESAGSAQHLGKHGFQSSSHRQRRLQYRRRLFRQYTRRGSAPWDGDRCNEPTKTNCHISKWRNDLCA